MTVEESVRFTNPDLALKREWLETNGIGGFASSTIAGANSRRYHGLLTAATRPPVGRLVLLSKFEETLVVGATRFELSANRYPGVVHPQGHHFLKEFRLDPFPVFLYEAGGLQIEKRIFMVHGENTAVVEWEMKGDAAGDVRLEVRPLIAFRDYHATTHRNDGLDPRVVAEGPGLLSVQPYAGLPVLSFAHNAIEVTTEGFWYLNFEYDLELERGLDFREDLYSPCRADFDLRHGAAAIVASSDRRQAFDVDALREEEIDRRRQVAARSPSDDPLVRTLKVAADQFVVRRGDGRTIIAGYHWFSDWGRDTMIALPGLTLVTGRFEEARGILLEFARHVDRGLLPNRFPDAGEAPEYNTVDATLWYFEAVRAYLQYTGDDDLLRHSLYPVLVDIIDWHVRGTRHGIRVDADGLLRAGEPGVQLTWMDAKVGDWVVTPRHGKPVEIQALWYNALRILEGFAERLGDLDVQLRCTQAAALARENFEPLFWNDPKGCLYDVVDGDVRDGSVRPNQVIAASLPHTMLCPERAVAMLEVVRRELLTPLGLRSLSPYDPRYRGRYEGDVTSRDSAYHQGAVWPWLMGPFLCAWVSAHGGSEQSHDDAGRWLREFESHLGEACVGQVSEIFDGDSPHAPRGCVAQAWSVAELLRAAVEDVWGQRSRGAVSV